MALYYYIYIARLVTLTICVIITWLWNGTRLNLFTSSATYFDFQVCIYVTKHHYNLMMKSPMAYSVMLKSPTPHNFMPKGSMADSPNYQSLQKLLIVFIEPFSHL